VVGRGVCRAKSRRQQARAVRLSSSREAHEHHECGPAARTLRYADLRTQLRHEVAAVLA
jgi:hypothetical protein